jgi:hypothetical protein
VLEPRDLRIMSPLAWLYSKLCWIRKMPGGGCYPLIFQCFCFKTGPCSVC